MEVIAGLAGEFSASPAHGDLVDSGLGCGVVYSAEEVCEAVRLGLDKENFSSGSYGMSPLHVERYLKSPAAVGPRRTLGCGNVKAAIGSCTGGETELSVEGVKIALDVGIVEGIYDSYCLA